MSSTSRRHASIPGYVTPPSKRRLRVYAFDPHASVDLDTANINDAVIELSWEKPWQDPLAPGPVNEYLEVIDYDWPSRTFYEPVDLDDPFLLAQDGLPLSEGCPQFHQQMVFAVAMKTIEDFERALGRHVFWSFPEVAPRRGERYPDFVKRLRIYPHALRQANAYYSPAKGALLFGYFKGEPEAPGLQEPWVFTCLSADIVAHETTHAILHGMRRRSIEASNPDSLALHEGFADVVALMQHFTRHQVVRHELKRTAGTLRSISLLTGLANQFGQATGRSGALRQALETLTDEQRSADRAQELQNRGKAAEPKYRRLSDVLEPHDRGQILVAAIFDAFVTIYERRTTDLFQLASVTPGSGQIPDILAERLAEEAAHAANAVMQMCVRGLDYLPAVSPTFGEYLRAIMTADRDLYPDDPLRYRVAVAEAFRKRGIPVPGCISYAPDSLCWDAPNLSDFEAIGEGDPQKLFATALGRMAYTPRYAAETDLSPANSASKARGPAGRHQRMIDFSSYRSGTSIPPNYREEAMRVVLHNQQQFHRWLNEPAPARDRANGELLERAWERLLGIRLMDLDDGDTCRSVKCRRRKGRRPQPLFQVHSVRIARRHTPDGRELAQMIAQVSQQRRGYYDLADQARVDAEGPRIDGSTGREEEPDFWFRGGATIIVDLRDGRLTHVIRKRIDNDERLERQRRFIFSDGTALAMAARSSSDGDGGVAEPFAMIHGAGE